MTTIDDDDYWALIERRKLTADRVELLASIANWIRTSLSMIFVGWLVMKILAHYGVL